MNLQQIVIGALAIVVLGQAVTSCFERRARRKERIAGANALAEHSRTEYRLVGQLQVASRYLYQGQVQLDATQRERDQAAKLNVGLRLEGDSLRGRLAVRPEVTTDGVRFQTGWGDLDSNGVHVSTDVELRGVARVVGRELEGTIFYNVTLAPIHLTVGASCEGANARFLVSGPRHRRVTIGRGTIDDTVCHPPPGYRLFDWKPPSLPVAAGLVTGGFLLCRFVLCGRD